MRNATSPLAGRYSNADLENDLSYQYRRRIGLELRDARVSAGLTQVELGKLLGIQGTAISGMEVGRASLPPERYEEIAEICGIPKAPWGKFLLRYSNPWLYALIYGHRAQDLKRDLNMIPERIARPE